MKISEKLTLRIENMVSRQIPYYSKTDDLVGWKVVRLERTYRGRWQAEGGCYSWIALAKWNPVNAGVEIASWATMKECADSPEWTIYVTSWGTVEISPE